MSSAPASAAFSTGANYLNGASGGASDNYPTPLPSTCVRQYWDPRSYNLLSFENDCGQAIYLTFIFNRTVGWAMTGSMNLAPGNHQNTGRSQSDINQAQGFDLYVRPANSLPVDMNGNVLVSANVSRFLCQP